ncbi:antiviral reverse transcriptase Drt3a [Burkholderia gladioli]|uniref:antiviral reverse transcriptase Drt3a n=1 Tax=Burkholderia gladioli TaxID=28095 RepID=UPI003132EE4F
MIEIAYTKRRIAKCVNYSDLIDDKSLLDRANRDATALSALNAINNDTLFQKNLTSLKIRGKQAFACANIEQTLVTRLISKNIKANYKIRVQNRNTIIKNLISSLRESSPYNIHRFDIESFFESVNREKLFAKLMNDDRCSRQTLLLIYQLFEQIKAQGISGLPRGIGLSSTLSELALHDFDSVIKQQKNIFFYARFVDDIILITSPELQKGEVIELLEKNLQFDLKLHKVGKKISHHNISKASDKNSPKTAAPEKFQYLGYVFSVFNSSTQNDKILGISRRQLKIDICEEKVDKIKSRLISSFTNHISNSTASGSFDLLEMRIRALTGNYIINDPSTNTSIKTGIYYNYSEKNNRVQCPLKNLDAFLRGLLFSSHHQLSLRIQSKIPFDKRRKLIGYTFTDGFYNARLHFFRHEDLRKIKEVWKK